MMRPKTLTLTANGTSQAVPLDYYANGVAIGVVVSGTGTATYTVQHTFADIGNINVNNTNVTWLNNDDSALVNGTSTQDGNYEFIPRASRIVLSNVSAATVKFTLIHKGGME